MRINKTTTTWITFFDKGAKKQSIIWTQCNWYRNVFSSIQHECAFVRFSFYPPVKLPLCNNPPRVVPRIHFRDELYTHYYPLLRGNVEIRNNTPLRTCSLSSVLPSMKSINTHETLNKNLFFDIYLLFFTVIFIALNKLLKAHKKNDKNHYIYSDFYRFV